MIPRVVVMEIERLLSIGHSQRAVARMMGVSRGSVGAIANGTRVLHPKKDPKIARPNGPLVRCPTCGVLVRTPCVACALRSLGLSLDPSGIAVDDRYPLALDLMPSDRRRYEEVRLWRRRNEEKPRPFHLGFESMLEAERSKDEAVMD